MKNILVTGSTGCIGSNLIIELLHQGYNVRAFRRATSNTITLKDVEVEHFIGDILDRESLHRAIKGCDTVFHTAALVSFWKRKQDEQFNVNVTGTKNVVDVCLELGIEKLIHTSTIATLGHRPGKDLIDETVAYNWGTKYSYRYTKYLAEQEVQKGIQKGLSATILNPSIVIGPRDVNAHGGIIIHGIRHGRIPAYIVGGINIVGVHDVVTGEISAARHGRCGERYILGGVNLTMQEVFNLSAKILNGKAPKIKAPTWLVKAAGIIFDILGDISGIQPPLTSDLTAAAGMFNWYSIEKAKRELNYQPSSIEIAIKDASRWFEDNGMI